MTHPYRRFVSESVRIFGNVLHWPSRLIGGPATPSCFRNKRIGWYVGQIVCNFTPLISPKPRPPFRISATIAENRELLNTCPHSILSKTRRRLDICHRAACNLRGLPGVCHQMARRLRERCLAVCLLGSRRAAQKNSVQVLRKYWSTFRKGMRRWRSLKGSFGNILKMGLIRRRSESSFD